MTEIDFKPKFRGDGSVDPECLEAAGLRWIKQWLRSRLSGDDPYFPLDTRVNEDPEALVLAVVRDAGLGHPVAALISRAVLSLLDESRKAAPKIRPYFANLLRLCQRIHLPQAGAWFAEEVVELAKAPAKTEKRWGGYEIVKEIIFAAIVQAPGLPKAVSRKAWVALMRRPGYATQSLLALGDSIEARAPHLAVWWKFCPPQERQAELVQMIFAAMRSGTDGQDSLPATLSSIGHSFPADLREAINRALKTNGAPPAFFHPKKKRPVSGSIENAIRNVAQKPEDVLARAG